MTPGLTVGSRSSHAWTVTDSELVPALFGGTAFADMPAVLATAHMVGLMEWACVLHLRPYYRPGQSSVGVHVDVDHSAPTLPGQRVTVETELQQIDGRFIWFGVRAHDGIDVIGQGRHRRALIDTAKFNDRLIAKGEQAGREG